MRCFSARKRSENTVSIRSYPMFRFRRWIRRPSNASGPRLARRFASIALRRWFKPVTEQIYLSSPDVGATEEAAVVRAIRSGWVAPLGPEVDAFEAELAELTQRQHAVALSSGTAALHLALLNFGVGAGDVVITSTMTFAATANAITYTGATPVFVDCDWTGNVDVQLLREAVVDQRRQGSGWLPWCRSTCWARSLTTTASSRLPRIM